MKRNCFSRTALALVAAGLLIAAAPRLQAADDGLNPAFALTPEMQQRIERERYYPSRTRAQFESRKRWKKAWIASWAGFIAVNAVDIHSSIGRREANPLLRNSSGQFSAGKGIALKAAIGGAFFAFQHLMVKRNPEKNLYKTFTLTNAAASGAIGAVAARNYGN